ncbi:hypothetical protein [Pararhodonellum marinum]|uniref:hypothetical protein n=1 Tax=Pararhodonellum marinum TaxID=2755358 RepID=UPI00188DD42A|nr:hypothetical protein [Pararhodonellum marinum]
MDFINDLLEKLFPKKSTAISHKENFTQSETAVQQVISWSEGNEGRSLMEKAYQNYQLKKANINGEPEVHILNSPYANGFAISFAKPFTEETFSLLFFAFGQRILDLGYERVSLDRKIQEIPEAVKITEKQYFKPPIANIDFTQKIDQIFGNISIEKVAVNHESSFLKVLVTVYSDHLYKEAMPFDKFIEALFQK